MIFVNLGKMRKKPDKALTGDATKIVEEFKKKGIKILNWYWTLGRYDTVVVFEAANEKEALKFSLGVAEFVATETLVAIPRQEAINLL
ncbi:MAG TPA: GYD domain-containing protein [Candidatus Bathyarchaeia archaeon]